MKKKKLLNKLDNGAIAKIASLTSDAFSDYKKRQKQKKKDLKIKKKKKELSK